MDLIPFQKYNSMYRESNRVAWHENRNQTNGTMEMSASGPSQRRCLSLVSFLKRTKIFIMSTLKSKSFIAARCFVLFFIVLNLCPHPGRAPDSLYLHHSIYIPDPAQDSPYSFFITSQHELRFKPPVADT